MKLSAENRHVQPLCTHLFIGRYAKGPWVRTVGSFSTGVHRLAYSIKRKVHTQGITTDVTVVVVVVVAG